MSDKGQPDKPSDSEEMLRAARDGVAGDSSPTERRSDRAGPADLLSSRSSDMPEERVTQADGANEQARTDVSATERRRRIADALTGQQAAAEAEGWRFRIIEQSVDAAVYEVKPPFRGSGWRKVRVAVDNIGEVQVREVGFGEARVYEAGKTPGAAELAAEADEEAADFISVDPGTDTEEWLESEAEMVPTPKLVDFFNPHSHRFDLRADSRQLGTVVSRFRGCGPMEGANMCRTTELTLDGGATFSVETVPPTTAQETEKRKVLGVFTRRLRHPLVSRVVLLTDKSIGAIARSQFIGPSAGQIVAKDWRFSMRPSYAARHGQLGNRLTIETLGRWRKRYLLKPTAQVPLVAAIMYWHVLVGDTDLHSSGGGG